MFLLFFQSNLTHQSAHAYYLWQVLLSYVRQHIRFTCIYFSFQFSESVPNMHFWSPLPNHILHLLPKGHFRNNTSYLPKKTQTSYLHARMSAKYCSQSESVCLYVCLSTHISQQALSSSWDGRPFGHNKHRGHNKHWPKFGGCVPFSAGGSWVPI